jgi:anaerobic magnesium-protoporphyrin IX monomethyl ester cyclase
MKIMLMMTPLHPELEDFKLSGTPPLGIYVVGSILRNQGYETEFCDESTLEDYYTADGWNESQIEGLIDGCNIIGFSANSFNWGTAREFIEIIKKRKDAPFVICGGIHPTNFDTYVLENSRVDLIVRGDAENKIVKVVEAVKNKKSFHDIPGITFREGDRIIRNPMENNNKLIDTPISCYREMLQHLQLNVPVETSRGCSFDCAFCSVNHRRNWRGLDVDTVVQKVHQALPHIHKVKLKGINLVDDHFCGDLQRAADILRLIGKIDKDFRVSIEARCTDFLQNRIDLAAVVPGDKMSAIHMGLDSGYDDGLRKINKGFLVKHIHECLTKCQACGLEGKVAVSMIVGFPWEDVTDCLTTIDFANHIREKYQIEVLFIFWWMPMVSRLWYQQDEYGFHISESIYDDPLWIARKNFIYPLHPKLDEGDYEIIDLHVVNPMGNLMKRENQIKGFEL